MNRPGAKSAGFASLKKYERSRAESSWVPRKGDRRAAIEHYTTALELEPTSWRAHEEIGDVLRGEGTTHEAAAHYRAALALNPSALGARAALASLPAPRDGEP